MATPIASTVYKLAIAGEQAGFSIEQMIWLLNAGLSLEMLIDFIDWRLRAQEAHDQTPPLHSSLWIM